MIEVLNLTRQRINTEKLLLMVRKILYLEKSGQWDISVCLIGARRMREINRKFRKKDAVTDVLSFGELQGPNGKTKLGQIMICVHQVKKNARALQKSFEEELKSVLVHSVLHLLGYEHEKSKQKAHIMRQKEKEYEDKLA